MNPPGAPSNETWAPSGAGTTEEAEILHMDMRSVSLGMGKFFYGHQKVPPAHSPKTGEWGFTAKDQHRLAGEDSDPTGASPCLLHRGTPVSTSSRSRCHLPPPWGQSPGWAWLQELQTVGQKDATTISRAGDGEVSPQGGGRAASGLLGQEQTTSEEGFAARLALGVPEASCTLLPRRRRSLLPQGRGQGGWTWSCGSIHVTLVLQRRC